MRKKEIAGIAFVVLAVTAFGLTRLSIDVHAISLRDPGLLVRTGLFSGLLIAIAIGCGEAGKRIAAKAAVGAAAGVGAAKDVAGALTAGVSAGWVTVRAAAETAAALHATRAGVWYNLGNLGLGFITAGLARFGRGIFDAVEIAVFLTAVALTIAGNMYGIAATQHALAHGRAAIAIPLQNGVTQVLHVCIFFLVYRPYVPTAESFFFLGAAAVLLISGISLLTGRLAAKTGGRNRRKRGQPRTNRPHGRPGIMILQGSHRATSFPPESCSIM